MKPFASVSHFYIINTAVIVGWIASLGIGRAAATVTITFAPQTGANESAFVSDTESGFTVTPLTTNWFVGQIYGNPIPSIFDGPIGTPSTATIQVTDGGTPFTFDSVDDSSNNGQSGFHIAASLGGNSVYSESATLANAAGAFQTYSSTLADAAKLIDTLDITITPGSGTTSVNLDNIVLNASVPEPVTGTSILLGLGILAMRRRAGV